MYLSKLIDITWVGKVNMPYCYNMLANAKIRQLLSTCPQSIFERFFQRIPYCLQFRNGVKNLRIPSFFQFWSSPILDFDTNSITKSSWR